QNIRLLHRLIKRPMTYVLHASMTPYATGLFIHASKEQMRDILLILAWLVAFASRTRVRGFSPVNQGFA
ncbi:MAG: hypothetical protein J5626_06050, partial [Lachnospiraceae bacterium]|nr:hypothetical protein [Lachnospiraceae bacterium]